MFKLLKYKTILLCHAVRYFTERHILFRMMFDIAKTRNFAELDAKYAEYQFI